MFPSTQLPIFHSDTCSAEPHKIPNEGNHESVQFTNKLSYAHTGLLII